MFSNDQEIVNEMINVCQASFFLRTSETFKFDLSLCLVSCYDVHTRVTIIWSVVRFLTCI